MLGVWNALSSGLDFELSCIIVVLTQCVCVCPCWRGVVVLVMNDWSHTDAECTVSSRPVAALSPEVEASCCLLSSLRFSSDRRQRSFMELYTSTASQSQLRGTPPHPHPSSNS